MAQQAANLSSQLTTGKVPIPRFKAGLITDAAYNEMELQLKAALTSQQCGDAWSSIPCVADDSAANAAANTGSDAGRKGIVQADAAIALLIASFSQNKSLTSVIKRSHPQHGQMESHGKSTIDSRKDSSVSTRPDGNIVWHN